MTEIELLAKILDELQKMNATIDFLKPLVIVMFGVSLLTLLKRIVWRTTNVT